MITLHVKTKSGKDYEFEISEARELMAELNKLFSERDGGRPTHLLNSKDYAHPVEYRLDTPFTGEPI